MGSPLRFMDSSFLRNSGPLEISEVRSSRFLKAMKRAKKKNSFLLMFMLCHVADGAIAF